jgi:putative ABC transport system substrate-binding protein
MDSRRRQLLIAAGTALAAPLAGAQQSQKLRRIGFLALQPIRSGAQEWWQAGLQRAGYDIGKNVVVEWRSADADPGRLPALAEELVRLKVELILTGSRESDEAAKRATSTIPIVMMGTLFPVERGLISSLGRPGGNVTGTVWFADYQDVSSKKYQIFRDAVPNASRVSSIWYDADPMMRFLDRPLERRRAEAIGMSVQPFPMQRRDELVANAALDCLVLDVRALGQRSEVAHDERPAVLHRMCEH